MYFCLGVNKVLVLVLVLVLSPGFHAPTMSFPVAGCLMITLLLSPGFHVPTMSFPVTGCIMITFPDTLKIAKVIPLYKKGDKTLLENYRPNSVLPSISKIFERNIFNQINDHFTYHDLYYNGQYGFREKHSTQLAALELIDRITHALDMGNTPINIYIDLSKAFDTLDHTILISKLQHYGITGAALQLLVSYLSNRKQFVQYGDLLSQKTDILMGVPQGSILGPLLFIIIHK